jgi:hypothetical protein
MPTIVEGVSYQPVTVQVRAIFQSSQFEICGGQRGTVTCFNWVIRYSPVSTYSPMSLILLLFFNFISPDVFHIKTKYIHLSNTSIYTSKKHALGLVDAF